MEEVVPVLVIIDNIWCVEAGPAVVSWWWWWCLAVSW